MRRWRWCSAYTSAAPSIRFGRRAPRRSGKLPPAARQSHQPRGRHPPGRAISGADRTSARLAARFAKATALFHIAFNLATAIPFIGLLDSLARLKTILPKRVQEADPSRPRYLDESALETPSLALADARETLHMGDHVEVMLRKVMAAMMTTDRALVDQVSRMDNNVDSLDEAIKLYVTKLTRGSLDEREGQRAMEIISFAINLEHIGDIIDKNPSELATKKIKRRFQFSPPEGAEELSAFHKRIVDLAANRVRRSHVRRRQRGSMPLAEYAALRNAELAATERHPTACAKAGPRPSRRRRPSRRAARSPAHSLTYLFGRLFRARRRRPPAAYRSTESGGQRGRPVLRPVVISDPVSLTPARDLHDQHDVADIG